MKNLSRKLFFILLICFAVLASILFWDHNFLLKSRPHLGTAALSIVNALVLLVFFLLLFFFLKATVVKPLERLQDSLLLFQRTGSTRLPARRPFFFKEIGKIFASQEKILSQFHE